MDACGWLKHNVYFSGFPIPMESHCYIAYPCMFPSTLFLEGHTRVRDFWAPPFGRRRLGAAVWVRGHLGAGRLGAGRLGAVIVYTNVKSGIELNNYWNISVD